VAFSGSAQVLAAPTTDHDEAAASLQRLEVADSTAIGEAVFTSLDQIASMAANRDDAETPQPSTGSDQGATDGGNGDTEPNQQAPERIPGRIVLLSDGSNTQGRDPEQAAQAASDAQVPVSTIAYGTPDGTIDLGGRQVPVPADEEAMAQLADATGGQTYTATSGDELEAVYEDIGSSIGWRTEPREITPYLAAAAFLFLLGAGAMSLRWFARLP
jgi:Ca-activated chloride channel family protein